MLKSGCVKLAQQTGAFLIPFTLSASRKKVLNSWDAFEIIRPFSRVTAVYGQPIAPDSQLMQQEVETARQRVEELMNHLEQATDAAFQ